MAKRWLVGEAIKVLHSDDKEGRIDVAKRFPLFATATVQDILDSVDMSVRQVERRLRGEDDANNEDGDAEEKPKKVKKEKVEKKEKKVKPKKEDDDDNEEDDDLDSLFDNDE